MPAAGALIEMPAEGGGATPLDGQQHFDVLPGDPFAAPFDECISCGADEIGHLERRPAHLPVPGWLVFQLQRVQRTRGRVEMTDRKSTRLNSSHIQKSRMPSSA